jgi:hypothetical protein
MSNVSFSGFVSQCIHVCVCVRERESVCVCENSFRKCTAAGSVRRCWKYGQPFDFHFALKTTATATHVLLLTSCERHKPESCWLHSLPIFIITIPFWGGRGVGMLSHEPSPMKDSQESEPPTQQSTLDESKRCGTNK